MLILDLWGRSVKQPMLQSHPTKEVGDEGAHDGTCGNSPGGDSGTGAVVGTAKRREVGGAKCWQA